VRDYGAAPESQLYVRAEVRNEGGTTARAVRVWWEARGLRGRPVTLGDIPPGENRQAQIIFPRGFVSFGGAGHHEPPTAHTEFRLLATPVNGAPETIVPWPPESE
jgi:hypothetical protein